ncbi:hypothetical protein JTE90_012615 [Oedothorax gibbosus]|uniref:Uncharacterized protein n=1 Tax=Oedothorax gibbosus TaxID=931172 RepID=A0AAV6TIZ0_9ARAC|nr:hypothetical protein JTE90_012615 [Oedothorax gibbosus]
MNETAPKKAADDDSEEVQRKNEENFDYTPPQDSLMQDPRILLQMNCVPLIRISNEGLSYLYSILSVMHAQFIAKVYDGECSADLNLVPFHNA